MTGTLPVVAQPEPPEDSFGVLTLQNLGPVGGHHVDRSLTVTQIAAA